MEKRRGDEMTAVCYDMMKDMYKIGAVSEEEMREFEDNCFVDDTEIANNRRLAGMSKRQKVYANQ
jgi:hypothetical protein